MLTTQNPPGLPATAKYHLPPMHPEGRKFAGIAALATLVIGFGFHWVTAAWLMAAVTVWVVLFFRDPERVTPVGDGLIVSPADGMVSMIADVAVPRQLGGEGGIATAAGSATGTGSTGGVGGIASVAGSSESAWIDGPITSTAADLASPTNGVLIASAPAMMKRVSIFMNVFDVHINRTPITGTVSRVVYVPGKFLNADLDKASDDNERQYFIVEAGDGTRVGFTQIAGLIARRIMRFIQAGDAVVAGQRIGLIRFGSRVDVYLPAGYGCNVLPGQRCVAGETILARRGEPNILVGVTQ